MLFRNGRSRGRRFSLGRARLLLAVGWTFQCTAPLTGVPAPSLSAATSKTVAPELRQLVDQYYAATNAKTLAAAVRRAKRLAPRSFLYHEIAAHLATLSADHGVAFDHLVAALCDTANDDPGLHLAMLVDIPWTRAERKTAMALLDVLARQHPDWTVRARASQLSMTFHYQQDELDAVQSAREQIAPSLSWSAIGTWDNEQGKGFDVPFPPEHEIDAQGRYPGNLVEVQWRPELPTRPDGNALDLGALFHPTNWALAYAVTAFRIEQEGAYQLRVMSSTPIKIWVNGQLLFQEQTIDAHIFDQLVLPVTLRRGVNRVLIKTAQTKGPWLLSARITAPSGAPPNDLVPVPFDTPPATGAPAGPLVTISQLIAQRVAGMPGASLRTHFHALAWSRLMGFSHQSTTLGDELAQQSPGSIPSRYALATCLWNHGERGRTADLLSALEVEAGDELLFLRLQQVRFLQQEGLLEDARENLIAIRSIAPANPEVWVRLASLFGAEGWVEDRCRALDEAERLRPNWLTIERERAECHGRLGFREMSEQLYRRILTDLPNDVTVLKALQKMARKQRDLSEAEQLASRLTAVAPHLPWTWLRLGEVRRRRGDTAGAKRALLHARTLDPDSPAPWRAIGHLAYQNDNIAEAISSWKEALTRNPANEKLAHRLAFLTPKNPEPWAVDIPNEEGLRAAVAARKTTPVQPGTNVLNLLDHEVMRINPDGSATSVVTQVMHPVNESGRDQITRVGLRKGGRIRVFHAYAVSPTEQHIQVSSVRNRIARFRGLKVGSTVVLQYQHDMPPVGYLARHVARGWWFQGVGFQQLLSQWIVWAPRDTQFHQWVLGDVAKETSTVGNDIRVTWTARDVAPIQPEPFMPTISEVANNMLVSTVPDWDSFLEWERALLHEVFRESPEVKAIAAQLFAGQPDLLAKLNRLHQYVMTEIRYQQDYEDHIAGVKPHPATVVLKRGYGDCKDKAVLFITLARMAGVNAQIALVRTRSRGPLHREIPMQQFNHVIVYVPTQPGLDKALFFDPTADALDLDVLPLGDVGVTALALDPQTGAHSWLPVPLQTAGHNRRFVTSRFALAANGTATGTVQVEARGHEGSMFRRLARNQKELEQGLQMFVGHTYPGAVVSDIEPDPMDDLSQPARISMTVDSPSHGRLEASTIKVSLPEVWSPGKVFQLAKRQFPLVLGPPLSFAWRSEIQLPKGVSVISLPASARVHTQCFAYDRKTTRKNNQILVTQELETTCERIPVDQYVAHRQRTKELLRLYKQDIVVRLPAVAQRVSLAR